MGGLFLSLEAFDLGEVFLDASEAVVMRHRLWVLGRIMLNRLIMPHGRYLLRPAVTGGVFIVLLIFVDPAFGVVAISFQS